MKVTDCANCLQPGICIDKAAQRYVCDNTEDVCYGIKWTTMPDGTHRIEIESINRWTFAQQHPRGVTQ